MRKGEHRQAALRRAKRILPYATAMLIALCAGCVYRGAKVVEGTDLAVGMELPGSDGTAQLNVLNYLSGFRLGVAKDAEMTVRYASAETNSWFGVCTTRSAKTVEATVTPLRPTNAACRCAASTAATTD